MAQTTLSPAEKSHRPGKHRLAQRRSAASRRQRTAAADFTAGTDKKLFPVPFLCSAVHSISVVNFVGSSIREIREIRGEKSPEKPATRSSENRKIRECAEKGLAKILPVPLLRILRRLR
jgi:hypothetical protein